MKRDTKTLKTKKTSVTIDDLALMVANGFQDMGKRMDTMEHRLDARIDGLGQKLNTVHTEVLATNYDHRKLRVRMENVELKVFGSIQEA